MRANVKTFFEPAPGSLEYKVINDKEYIVWSKVSRGNGEEIHRGNSLSVMMTCLQEYAQLHTRIVYLPHAVRQMSRPDRMISTAEISSVVQGGELIEDYPEDQRGHSGLILGFGDANRLYMWSAHRKQITLQ